MPAPPHGLRPVRAALWGLLALSACAGRRATAAEPDHVARIAGGALLFDDLGDHHREVTTRSPEAQRFFDQGLRLAYGFNHDEAARSFARAAQLDPDCAACSWGLALVLGPNYNVPMLPDRFAAAWQALERARAAAGRASPVERALIEALSKRYAGPAPKTPAEMQPLQEAYGAAMREVARRFPADDDVQVLFAESLMDVRPWMLWTNDGKPAPDTAELIAALETVLARSERHPGANHYYIHAIEPSPEPGRALPSAERLGALMPGAGHVVHMPAHIFQRVGRYADAAAANRAAIEADRRYMARVEPPGYYPMYLAHNEGFLAWSASMMGRRAEGTEAARASAKAMPPAMLSMMPGMDFFASAPQFTLVRFGRWREALDEPPPPAAFPVLTALWRHSRGVAFASLGQLPAARRELAEVRRIQSTLPADTKAGNNPAQRVLELAARTVEARIAERERRPGAIERWQAAVALEDQLNYAEPADWFYPLRHFLGAALLDAKRPAEAEAVYLADLAEHPENGWALFGLWKAQMAQRKHDAAATTKKRFDAAWAQADIRITRSAF